MQNPVLRLLVVLLLLGAAGAGAFLTRPQPEAAAAAAPDAGFDERVDRLVLLVHDLHATQTAYVAPSQESGAALQRYPDVMREITAMAAHASALATTEETAAALRDFVDATSRVAQTDAAIREQLLQGDDVSAAQLVHGEAREAVRAMTAALVTARAGERTAGRAPDAPSARGGLVLAIVAALWAAGLIVFALVPPRAAPSTPAPAGPFDRAATAPSPSEPAAAVQPPSATLDTAAAALCADIARVETAADLTPLLDRAAALLSAERVVIWLASRDRLFAAAASGGTTAPSADPVARDAATPLATAWRDGVPAASAAETRPTIVASPLVAGSTCRGVLGVELARDADPATSALVTILAAQLAGVVAGAPAEGVSRAAGGA